MCKRKATRLAMIKNHIKCMTAVSWRLWSMPVCLRMDAEKQTQVCLERLSPGNKYSSTPFDGKFNI